MNHRLLSLPLLALVLAAAGCRSTAPKTAAMVKPAMPPVATNAIVAKPSVPAPVAASVPPAQVKAEAKPSTEPSKEQLQEIKDLEKTLADRRSAQEKLQKDMEKLRNDLFESAQTLRDIKIRADVLTGREQTNAFAVASLQDSLKQIQGLPATEVKALQDALAREKQATDKNAAALQQSQKEIAELKKQLEAAPAKPSAPPVASPGMTQNAPAASVESKPVPVPAPPTVASAAQLTAEGKQLLRQGKLPEAAQAFQSALALSPGMTGARVGLAACRYNAGDLEQAKRLVGDVLAADKHNAQALGLKGIIAWREGDFRDAVDILGDAIKADPADAQLHNYLAVALNSREQYDDAIAELRKAVSLDPENAEAQYNLSVLLATARSPSLQDARMHYEQALHLGNPRDEAMDKILYGGNAP